jgi:hypothetical protein
MEMYHLFKPYGMRVLPESKESFDFHGRWICTGTEGDNEILCDLPEWCPLPSHSAIQQPGQQERTPIICLCGSTRFTREMLIKQWELTKQGYIVVSWCALPDDYYKGEDKAHVGDQEGVKMFVDEIHKRKIDISDEVLVIDIGGYIGESTRSEINYAAKQGKPIRYLSEES